MEEMKIDEPGPSNASVEEPAAETSVAAEAPTEIKKTWVNNIWKFYVS